MVFSIGGIFPFGVLQVRLAGIPGRGGAAFGIVPQVTIPFSIRKQSLSNGIALSLSLSSASK